MFAWLASAPILHGGRLAPTTGWERLSREAAVVAGRDDWDMRLSAVRRAERARAAEAELDDDEPEWRAGRLRAEGTRGARSCGSSCSPSSTTSPPRPPGRAGGASTRPGPSDGSAGSSAAPAAGSAGTTRPSARRPSGSRRPSHRLGALDAVEDAVTLDVFHRTLELELEHDLGRVGRFGDGVLVGSVEMGIGLDLDLVVILGLAEGSFPATVRDDSLLPDHERARTAGELALRADRVERQHHQLLAALAGADRQLLCVPRGDLRRSVERVAVALGARPRHPPRRHGPRGGGRPTCSAPREPWVRHVASFDAGLRHLDVPATAQEHRLRALLATDGDLRGHRRRHAPPSAPRSSRPGAADRFTRFDGNLAGLPVPSPGRPHHLAHPPRALGRLPPPPPRGRPPAGRAPWRTPRTT